jgi:hypothetical protein
MRFQALLRELFKVKAIPKGKLRCADCGRHIHRHDKYKVLAVQHISCLDPKNVGQTSLPVHKEG